MPTARNGSTFTVNVPDEQAEQPASMPGLEVFFRDGVPPSRNAASNIKDGKIKVGAFTLTAKGLEISGKVSLEDWSNVGEALLNLEGSIQWLIGDWLVYGEDFQYGDVKALAESMGREPGTFWDYAYISRHVKTSIRIEVLSFGHHRLVAPLTEEQQIYSLHHAAENKMSVNAFRKWLDEQQGKSKPTPILSTGNTPVSKLPSADFEKMLNADPTKAKPQEREKAISVYEQMARAMEAYRRLWGID